MDFHYKGKTIVKPSYLYNGNPYTCKMASLYWDIPQFVFWAPFFGFDSVALGQSYDKTDRWKTETHHSTNRVYSWKWCMHSSTPCVQEAILINIHIVICMNESRVWVRQLHIWEWEPAYHLGDDFPRSYYFCGERKILLVSSCLCCDTCKVLVVSSCLCSRPAKLLVTSCLCSKACKTWWFLPVCVQDLHSGGFFLFVFKARKMLGGSFACVQGLQYVGDFLLFVFKACKMLMVSSCIC